MNGEKLKNQVIHSYDHDGWGCSQVGLEIEFGVEPYLTRLSQVTKNWTRIGLNIWVGPGISGRLGGTESLVWRVGLQIRQQNESNKLSINEPNK